MRPENTRAATDAGRANAADAGRVDALVVVDLWLGMGAGAGASAGAGARGRGAANVPPPNPAAMRAWAMTLLDGSAGGATYGCGLGTR